MSDRDHVLNALKAHSVRVSPPGEPEFKLAAGGTSRFYCDVRATALRADCTVPLANLLFSAITPDVFGEVKAVAGVVLGGCHLASSVAFYSAISPNDVERLDVVFVRKQPKDHGTGKLVESPALPKGTRVVLLEDVVTTGDSSVSAAKSLSDAGFVVAGIVAVVDRRSQVGFLDELGGFPFRSIFRLPELIEGA